MNILENQQLAEPVDGLYQDLEAQILLNIARHLQGWEQPIATDTWLLQKLAELGRLNQENIKLIAKMSGLSQTAAERMLNASRILIRVSGILQGEDLQMKRLQ